jgi:hypothetical protein
MNDISIFICEDTIGESLSLGESLRRRVLIPKTFS